MRKQMYGVEICLVTVIFLTLTLLSGSTQAHPSRRLAAPSATTPCATGITPVPLQHVVVIMEENQPYGNGIGSSNAPFTNALVKGEVALTNGAWDPKINPGPLDTAVTNGALPAFSWITSNQCDDGHNLDFGLLLHQWRESVR